MNKLKHESKSICRISDSMNFGEKIFSDEWKANNEYDPTHFRENSILSQLMGNGMEVGKIDQRDATIAATVIQWLGSPIGYFWLQNVIKKIEKKEETQ